MRQDNPVTISTADAAQYIERLTGELATISSKAGMPFLAYLLSMAQQEAAQQGSNQSNQEERSSHG